MILFRCAKRSILPDKTTLLENELARLQSKFHSAKSQNSSLEYSFYLLSFEQFDKGYMLAAGCSKFYKTVRKLLKMTKREILILLLEKIRIQVCEDLGKKTGKSEYRES